MQGFLVYQPLCVVAWRRSLPPSASSSLWPLFCLRGALTDINGTVRCLRGASRVLKAREWPTRTHADLDSGLECKFERAESTRYTALLSLFVCVASS